MSQSKYFDIFSYDPLSGILRWKVAIKKKFKPGDEAGFDMETGRDKKPYKIIYYKKILIRSHHVVFDLMGVQIPENMMVDHIDGDGTNNKWENLRVVSQAENNVNKKIGRNNKTGVYGVYFYEKRNKWRASIGSSKANIFLGHFDNLLDAAACRKSAENKLGYHKNHGTAK